MASPTDAPGSSSPFDFSRWPVVIARMPGFSAFRMDEWLTGLTTVLDRNEPFVIVIDLAAFLEDPREDAAEKKKGTAWLKSRRADYKRLCRGNVYVVADPAARAAVLTETSKQGRKLGLAFEAAGDEATAVEIAHRLLARDESGR